VLKVNSPGRSLSKSEDDEGPATDDEVSVVDVEGPVAHDSMLMTGFSSVRSNYICRNNTGIISQVQMSRVRITFPEM
jgi:hypothetical protein